MRKVCRYKSLHITLQSLVPIESPNLKLQRSSSALRIHKIKVKHPRSSISSTQTTHINAIYPAPLFTALPLTHRTKYLQTSFSWTPPLNVNLIQQHNGKPYFLERPPPSASSTFPHHLRTYFITHFGSIEIYTPCLQIYIYVYICIYINIISLQSARWHCIL